MISFELVHLRGHMKIQSSRTVETIVPLAAAIADQEPAEREESPPRNREMWAFTVIHKRRDESEIEQTVQGDQRLRQCRTDMQEQ